LIGSGGFEQSCSAIKEERKKKERKEREKERKKAIDASPKKTKKKIATQKLEEKVQQHDEVVQTSKIGCRSQSRAYGKARNLENICP